MPVRFDASITLGAHHLGQNAQAEAVAAARYAVEAMPGAFWVSVDYGGDYPPHLQAVVVYPRGTCRIPATPAWVQLQAKVETVALRAAAAGAS
jgi:hypothetical protein